MVYFGDILGQDEAVAYLRRVSKSERIPPAFLFKGPSGCGRRTAAHAMAFAASCTKGDGCGQCESCKANLFGEGIRELSIPELLERKGTKVEHLRDELTRFRLTHRLQLMVVVVDGADQMNDAMQASMLKAVEEPSERVTYVLISENPERIFLTLRSRSVPVRFRPLSIKVIERILIAQGVTMTTSARELIALSGGSADVAKRLIEEYGSASEFEASFQKSLVGRPTRQDLLAKLRIAVPVLARRHPDWRSPLVELDTAIGRNANISLATGLFRTKTK